MGDRPLIWAAATNVRGKDEVSGSWLQPSASLYIVDHLESEWQIEKSVPSVALSFR